MPRQITIRAEGRASGSTVARVIACALRMSAKASFSQPSRIGSGYAGRSAGRAGLGIGIPYFINRETSSAARTLPIHQGGDDVDDVGRVDRLSKKHVVSGGASLANPESLGEKRHGDRGDIVAHRPRPHPPDELQTVLAGQPEVADDDVDLGGAQDLPGLGRGAGLVALLSLIPTVWAAAG